MSDVEVFVVVRKGNGDEYIEWRSPVRWTALSGTIKRHITKLIGEKK